jgi:hypothetical protein
MGLCCLGCGNPEDVVSSASGSGADASDVSSDGAECDVVYETQPDAVLDAVSDGVSEQEAEADAPSDVVEPVDSEAPDAEPDPHADGVPMDQVDVIAMGAGTPGVTQWAKTALLRGMNAHRGSYYGPESWYFQIDGEGHKDWPSYKPFGGEEDTPVCGNIWILVRQPGSTRWWAAPFEGLVDFTDIHPAGNLNFDHTNVLAGSPLAYPWQPASGEVYGWMLTTNVFFPGSNGQERTNVLLEAWP